MCRQSIVRALTEDGSKRLPAHMPEKFKKMSISGVPPLVRQNTMGDFEMIDLAPKVEGRIRKLDPQVSGYIILIAQPPPSYTKYSVFIYTNNIVTLI